MAYPVMPLGFLGNQGDSDTYRIERSLRFNSADSAYLNRTPSSATSRTVWTFSCWVKRSALTSNYTIFSAGTSAVTKIAFEADAAGNGDSLRVFDYDGASFNGHKITTALYRDTSSWYHIVVAWNTAEAAADRIKIYVNGSQVTSFSTNTNAGTGSTSVNNNVLHRIGQRSDAASGYFSGYIAEVHLIDGQALTPSSFGETDAITGRWKAKAYSGTYGTNGFYLKFADNSGTTSTTLGKDSSGNGNNWTPNNFSVTAGAGNDSLVDSPTNYGADTGIGGNVGGNYCTLNPLRYVGGGASTSIINGSLTFVFATSISGVTGTMAVSSGKWYWEIQSGGVGAAQTAAIGIGSATGNIGVNYTTTYGYLDNGNKITNGGGITAYGSSFTANDIIGVALNLDLGTLTFYKNNVSQGVAYSGISGDFSPWVQTANSGTSFVCNFGQRPFAYTAPSGFKALCTQNLTQPTIQKPSTAMDVVTYTGTGATQSITGLGFSPDLVWTKGRSLAQSHNLFDTLRSGFRLRSDTTGAEASTTVTLDSNGFTLGTETESNNNTSTFVAWAWDAGSTTSTNTSGSITSTVRANPQAGFSIVSFTGNGTTGSIGHGLGATPKMIILKGRSGAGRQWVVGHHGLDSSSPWSYYLFLEKTFARDSVGNINTWGNNSSVVSPTSYVFTVGNGLNMNASTETYIAYCFAEIEGYSKFGSYTGNGSADGPFVWCGFRPRWVILKRTDSTNNWIILDTSRDTFNSSRYQLLPNVSDAEYTVAETADMLSSGFKIRDTNASRNASGGTYIFAAFAESPFNYARAR